jgi:hypothetical protein
MGGLTPVAAELPSHALEANRGKVEMMHLIVMVPFEVLRVERDNVGIPDRVGRGLLDTNARTLLYFEGEPVGLYTEVGLPLRSTRSAAELWEGRESMWCD